MTKVEFDGTGRDREQHSGFAGQPKPEGPGVNSGWAPDESSPGLSRSIYGYIFEKAWGLPPILYWRGKELKELARASMRGEITNTGKVERINSRYHEWFRDVRDHLRR